MGFAKWISLLERGGSSRLYRTRPVKGAGGGGGCRALTQLSFVTLYYKLERHYTALFSQNCCVYKLQCYISGGLTGYDLKLR